MTYSRHQQCGVTPQQALARTFAGLEQPRPPTPREKLVAGLVASVCEHCGCTSARIVGSKPLPCDYCGKAPIRWAPADNSLSVSGRP